MDKWECFALLNPLLCPHNIQSLYSSCEAIKMSAVTKEKCVLKLVYPGHFVELHNNPITVAEVMKKHPRHCVTRPDVFRFPWIVVRPDSVLKPGRVFFVVPYHTIYRLLQEKGSSQDQSIVQEVHPPDHSQDHLPCLRKTSVLDSSTELTPEHIGCVSFFSRKSLVQSLTKHNSKSQHDQSSEQDYPIECSVKFTNFHRLLKKQSQNYSQKKEKTEPDDRSAGCLRQTYQAEAGSKEMDSNMHCNEKKLCAKMKVQYAGDQPPKKRYPVEKWPTAIANYKDHQHLLAFDTKDLGLHPRTNHGSDLEYTKQVTCSKSCLKKHEDDASKSQYLEVSRQYAFDTKDLGLQLRTGIVSDLESSKQVAQLKSCLKKHEDDASKSRGLRVTFAFPLDDKRKKSKTKSYKFCKKMERL